MSYIILVISLRVVTWFLIIKILLVLIKIVLIVIFYTYNNILYLITLPRTYYYDGVSHVYLVYYIYIYRV